MCCGHMPITPVSLSLLVWSTLLTPLSSSDQGQLSTVCCCLAQILSVVNGTEQEIGLIWSSYKC